MTCRTLPGMAIVFLVASPVLAQPPEPTAPPSATAGQTTGETRVEELERRLRELAARVQELETSDGNKRAEEPRQGEATAGQAPRAEAPVQESAESSPASQTGPISGYMDFHLNRPEQEDPQLDFHRFVLLFTHGFSERLRFTGELELEHGFVEGAEESGELELEQAYLDFKVKPEFNLRAGMLLAPVGIINERHEPPSYHGVERPFVDTFIIPSTWFDAGVGIHGAFGPGWQYRAYLMAPLDATRITAGEGLAEARQKGFRSNVRNIAQTARLENVGFPGLTLGASFWRGKTGFNFRREDSRVGVIEFDGRYHTGPFAVRGEFAQVFVDGANELNDLLQRTAGVSPNIARQMRGFYVEPSVRPVPRLRYDIAAFLRYENFDTQFRMPEGVLPLKQFDRAAWVVGASYFPDPDIAFKIDYTVIRNRSSLFRSADSLNIGLGWWF
ncbi:MAG: hypothetical protein DMF96_28890 [Acidobacteria bacterium]|nr:MAG: hypothetical protein DMF96_28890 [Acidobacteriota bacterium]